MIQPKSTVDLTNYIRNQPEATPRHYISQTLIHYNLKKLSIPSISTRHRLLSTSKMTSDDNSTTSSSPNKSKILLSKAGKNLQNLDFSCSIPQSALARTIRNLGKFSSYYAVLIWTVLFFTLVLHRKISFSYLIATTQITLLSYVLMRALPDLFLLHKAIDRRYVLFLGFVLLFLLVVITLFTSLVVILTGGGTFLFVSHAVTMGVVVLHAVLSNVEDDFVDELGEKSGDLV